MNYTVVCAPVSCVQLCTSTGTNLYNLNLRFTVRHARLSRSQKVLSCAQAAQLVARYSLASPVNIVLNYSVNLVFTRGDGDSYIPRESLIYVIRLSTREWWEPHKSTVDSVLVAMEK